MLVALEHLPVLACVIQSVTYATSAWYQRILQSVQQYVYLLYDSLLLCKLLVVGHSRCQGYSSHTTNRRPAQMHGYNIFAHDTLLHVVALCKLSIE